MAKYLKPRRGTATKRAASTVVLQQGEIFFEYPDSGAGKGIGRVFMGDGSTQLKSLTPFLEQRAATNVAGSTITFTTGTQTTIANAISKIASGSTLAVLIGAIKNALNLINTSVTKLNNDLGQHWNSTLVYTGTGAWTAQAKVTIPKDGIYLILRGAFCGGSGVLVGEHYDSGKYTGVDGANVVGKYISVESKSKNDVVATYTFSTGETCAGVTVVYLGPKK